MADGRKRANRTPPLARFFGPVGLTRARLQGQQDTRPGQTLLLGILAAAPIAVAFILAPVLASREAALALAPLALYATPFFAVWGLAVLVRSPPERRAHRASRIGGLLALTSLLMWVLVLAAALNGRL